MSFNFYYAGHILERQPMRTVLITKGKFLINLGQFEDKNPPKQHANLKFL